MAAAFIGNLMKGGAGDVTALRKKKFTEGTLRYNLYRQAQETLKAGVELKQAVKKPDEETFEDWLAVHVVDFFNRIQLLYGTVSEVCTEATCPVMSGGVKYEYLWQDATTPEFKKPKALSAPEYHERLFDWVQALISDEAVFPGDTDVEFPKTFRRTCHKILSRLFRVFVHVYIHHFDRLTSLHAEAHANTLFKHFYYFTAEFGLVEEKELAPLAELVDRICQD